MINAEGEKTAFNLIACFGPITIVANARNAPSNISGRKQMTADFANYCVQSTPDCALLFVVAQISGAPDAGRKK